MIGQIKEDVKVTDINGEITLTIPKGTWVKLADSTQDGFYECIIEQVIVFGTKQENVINVRENEELKVI